MTIAAWCLLAGFVLIYWPRGMAYRATRAQEGRYDILEPRAQQQRLAGKALRAQSAHQNMLEAFPAFAAAVLLNHILASDPLWRDGLALVFVVARVLYLPAYMRDWGYWRTAIWAVGFFATLGLFLLPAFV